MNDHNGECRKSDKENIITNIMRIVEIVKKFSDGHIIRYDIQAANAPIVYIDEEDAFPPQDYVVSSNKKYNYNDYGVNIDRCYFSRFKGNPQEWISIEVTYREECPDSAILYGFTIRSIEEKGKSIEYQCEYAGHQFCHRGIVEHISNWQKILFDEWRAKFPSE